jgi:hypothetical protein
MFSLTGATKFKYIPNYKDMRGGYDKLHGVVCSLGGKQEEGIAYVFTSRNQKPSTRCSWNERHLLYRVENCLIWNESIIRKGSTTC